MTVNIDIGNSLFQFSTKYILILIYILFSIHFVFFSPCYLNVTQSKEINWPYINYISKHEHNIDSSEYTYLSIWVKCTVFKRFKYPSVILQCHKEIHSVWIGCLNWNVSRSIYEYGRNREDTETVCLRNHKIEIFTRGSELKLIRDHVRWCEDEGSHWISDQISNTKITRC